ncbi:L-2-amino-thiazoline-4-carboxylic acid hydrolase [Rhodothermus profundi]|uniref:L-2-amino-thiazoline-4-carboxylic acid hydrolase n=1 Tax=Rhodothermus profundi TaxID=633813 RepID=A0A1M6UIZ6_9BACT|nr:L-2-amino-thiazoline-4-carboxylic acid hydrolase [Rhodothermus profundi]SHK69078.1 L-2-amino-thiazoline-4-carboxylic acid hydrolase [Rhodothermus profundi]
MSTQFSWHNWVARSFARVFTRRLGVLFRRYTNGAVLNRHALHEEAEQLRQSNQDLALDPPAQVHLLMTSYVLAGYRILQDHGLSPEAARALLQQAFAGMGRRWIWLFTWLQMRLARNPLEMLRQTARRRARTDYGATFHFSETGNAEAFTLLVHRCFYYDFFRRNGHPELTLIFCAWDRNWADAIRPERDGVRFERPTTLAEGQDACRFVFRRDTRPQNPA